MAKRSRPRRLALAAACLAALLCLLAGLFVGVGRWLQLEEPPEPAGLIVVLAGGPDRAIKAAELFARGLAPEVWVSRPIRDPWLAHLDAIGVSLPAEEDIVRRVLVKQGVPESRIRYYGRDVLSTAEEAISLREALGERKETILLVSHRIHLRRAQLIFRDQIPAARVVAVASDPEPARLRWWTDKNLATQVVGELTRLAYYEFGGRFLAHPH